MTFEEKLDHKIATHPLSERSIAVDCINFASWAREETVNEVLQIVEKKSEILGAHYESVEIILDLIREKFGVKDG